MITNNSNTVSTRFLTVIKRSLESHGIDSHQVFKKAGIAYENNSGRVKQQAISVVLNEAVKIVHDDAFAVKLVNYITPASSLLTVLAGSFDSLKTLFNISSHAYGETYINSIYPTLEDSKHVRMILDATESGEQYPLYTMDFVMIYIVKFFNNLLDDPLATPIFVKLERPEPVNVASFQEYFGCPIEFNAANNEICFDKRIYNLKNPQANTALSCATKSIIQNELKNITQVPLSKRTMSYIKYQLPEVLPKQEDWASCLHTNVRNMQRQLRLENTSFAEILKAERIKLAKKLIQDHVYSVAEIGNLLHFSDSSHFIKTFKLETGMTPTAYQTAQIIPEYSKCKTTLANIYGRKTEPWS